MLRDEVNKALNVIRSGGIILYPTDTVWGLGCDASNQDAINRIFELKGRPAEKSVIVLLDDAGRLSSYIAEVPDIAYDLIEFAEKPLTIVFPGARNMAPGAINEDGSAAIRVVKHDFCRQLIASMRKPLVSTSANISGQPTPASFDEISTTVKNGVDYIVELQQTNQPTGQPSTIMKLGPGGSFSFIRR